VTKSLLLQVTGFSSMSTFDGAWPADAAVALLDTSSYEGVLGWPFRNVLALLASNFHGQDVAVVALRTAQGQLDVDHSQVLHVRLPDLPAAWAEDSCRSAVMPGWEGASGGQVRSKAGARHHTRLCMSLLMFPVCMV
jgi:Ubiquitin-like modifier-activating enzyme ATG7 N-terminus